MNIAESQYHRISYSQFGEDIIVEHLFPTLEHGRYLDVGCYHPHRFSNTALLHRRGWRGVNIDANSKAIDIFRKVRPDDYNLNAIVKRPNEAARFYIFGDDCASNTASVQFAKAQAENAHIPLPAPIDVEQLALAVIIERYFGSQPIHYLNIDVEATELAVLDSGRWEHDRPWLISIEDGAFLFDEPSSSEIYRFLTSVDYVMYSRCHATSFFVDHKFWKYVQHGGSFEQASL